MTQPTNETKASFSRWTVDRRELKYKLEVVQQPEKARACGSGPRSSADRRPVDPPPVVELRVYANDVDVTMSYDATFMLYASLEVARPIAAGKMHTPQAIPVLTGVAVASAAYLDRPKPAAYFIFPDLSVRHEGWYRLKFSLFEGVKHESDADMGKPFVHPAPTASKYSSPVRHESMANRLEVQSVPFQVFSAKKFPGLAMSTNLSKLVAEQGCRVRIRRDIRQRKRQTKADGDVEEVHTSYQGTPQATYQAMDHSRSASRNSIGSQYEADLARRASVESLYRQPTIQSRQPSIAGLPSLSQSAVPAAMPPPPHGYVHAQSRVKPESSPIQSSYTTQQLAALPPFAPPPSLRQEQKPSIPIEMDSSMPRLPPLRNLPRPLYDIAESHPTKRGASSYFLDSEGSLKDRERPDARRYGSTQSRTFWSPETSIDGANQVIEPDNGDDEDSDCLAMDGPMIYVRADGTKQNKLRRGL